MERIDGSTPAGSRYSLVQRWEFFLLKFFGSAHWSNISRNKGRNRWLSTNKSSPGFFNAPWMGRLVTISCFQHFFGIINATYDNSSVTGRLFFILRFNNDPSIDILLLTTHVGGLRLNLTGADTVIFVEHDWKPMKDLQVRNHQPFEPVPSPLSTPIFTNFAQALFR